MNKAVAVAVGTFVLGGVTGALISKQYFEKKYEKLAQEEIDSVKEVFGFRRVEKDVCSEKGDTPEFDPDFRHVPPVSVRTSLDDNPYEKAKRDYSLISKMETEPVPEALVEAVLEDEEEEVVRDPSKPYLLDPEEYLEDDSWEKLTLVYFRDGVLCNEEEEIVDDIIHTIGNEAYALLLRHPAPMWVRNEPLGVDYEIVVMNHEYGEVMDPDSGDGKMRRRKTNEDQ